MFTCDLYAGSPPPHDLERLRTTMQRRVVDFVRVGYFIPPNGPLNGYPPSYNYNSIDNGCQPVRQCILSMDTTFVDNSRLSHLTDFVGHSIGALSCDFLLLCLCLLALQ